MGMFAFNQPKPVFSLSMRSGADGSRRWELIPGRGRDAALAAARFAPDAISALSQLDARRELRPGQSKRRPA
jgi:hypothetical protein